MEGRFFVFGNVLGYFFIVNIKKCWIDIISINLNVKFKWAKDGGGEEEGEEEGRE